MMPLLKRAKNVLQRLSEGAMKEIGFKRKIKELRNDPDSLTSVIEEEGLELANGADEIIKNNGVKGLGRPKNERPNKKKMKIEEKEPRSDGSEDDELEAYNSLFERVKTIDKDAGCKEKKKLVEIKFPSQVAALKSRLDDIKVTSTFSDNLVMVSADRLDLADDDVENEIRREKSFAKLAEEALITGLKLCKENKIPFKRPSDYYAEMIKSDERMHEIRTSLVKEVTKIETFEKARKQRHYAKFGKKLQAERLISRANKKSKTLKTIESAKKKGTLHKVLDEGLHEDHLNNGKDPRSTSRSHKMPSKSKKKVINSRKNRKPHGKKNVGPRRRNKR